MIRSLTPNRAVVFAVGAFLAYWIASMFVPPLVLRDIFNSLAFGTAVIITITWGPAAFRAVKNGADSGEWLLVLAIFLIWLVVLCQRLYVIAFNWLGRPESWALSPVSGFWPYSYTVAGMLFLSAPGFRDGDLSTRNIWAIILAVAIGSLLAGVMIGASISTV
ncbi:hypothetical protein [Rhizobium sp. 2MFCol3.1]|uniref:hypothetical protein n=1 Tax=Rhizobium sp. 2MFCol3.1 TaxID=1246459 RepID=UPI000365AAD2|nr:hypothetical protein [Rhizobium sp. 2MFCol3.1]